MTYMATPNIRTPALGVMKLSISNYMTYMATPLQKTPCPGGHESHNFSRPFLGHHYYILRLSDLCLGVKEKIFKEIMHFHYMTYMATP